MRKNLCGSLWSSVALCENFSVTFFVTQSSTDLPADRQGSTEFHRGITFYNFYCDVLKAPLRYLKVKFL